MKTLFAILFITATSSFGQVVFSLGGFQSNPLLNFSTEEYKNGYGIEMGFGYQFEINEKYDLELNTHFQFGENGEEKENFTFGKYTIENDFVDWQFEAKAIRKYNIFHPYFGLHFGVCNYNTNDSLNAQIYTAETQPFLKGKIYSRDVFQVGFSLGSYIPVSDYVSFDIGLSTNFAFQSVNFVSFNTYQSINNAVAYESGSAKPSLLLFQLGVTIKFNPDFFSSDHADYGENDNYEEPNFPSGKPTNKPKNPHFK